MGWQTIPHGRRCVHEGPFACYDSGIWDLVLIDGSSCDHGSLGFHYQEVGRDSDKAVFYLVHHQDACMGTALLEGVPSELGFHA